MVDTLFEMCRLTLLPCRPDITNYKVPVLDVHPMLFPHGASRLLVLTNPCHTTKIIESQWGLHYQLYIPKFRFVVYIILHSNPCWLPFLSSAWPSFPMLDTRTTKKETTQFVDISDLDWLIGIPIQSVNDKNSQWNMSQIGSCER